MLSFLPGQADPDGIGDKSVGTQDLLTTLSDVAAYVEQRAIANAHPQNIRLLVDDTMRTQRVGLLDISLQAPASKTVSKSVRSRQSPKSDESDEATN